jgi:hypothetical protein
LTRLRTTLTAALAVGALLATTAAGCGSDSSGGGRTVVVGGTGSVTCKQIPYNYALSSQDASGSGISISRGIIRGALWVTCGPSSPASFSITIVIKRNGIPVGKGSPYAGIPNTIGYEAWTIATCRPGVYRLQYTYRWTYNGGVQADTDTVATTETVTQHDCDA